MEEQQESTTLEVKVKIEDDCLNRLEQKMNFLLFLYGGYLGALIIKLFFT